MTPTSVCPPAAAARHETRTSARKRLLRMGPPFCLSMGRFAPRRGACRSRTTLPNRIRHRGWRRPPAFRISLAKAEGGKGSRVEGRPPRVPGDRLLERVRDVPPEVREREVLVAVGEKLELRQGLGQKLHAAGGPLPPGGLVESGGNLDETLEEKAARADGAEPLGLPHLVRLEEPPG